MWLIKQLRRSGFALLFIIIVIFFFSLLTTSNYINSNTLVGLSNRMSRVFEDTTQTEKYEAQSTCADTNIDELLRFFGEVKSDMKTWTFQKRIKCTINDIGEQYALKSRRKMSIKCLNNSVHETYSETFSSSDVFAVRYNDSCLETYIQTCCGTDHRIPNVVHYVWYLRGELTFVSFLSILSTIRFIKPCAIVFHGEMPFGRYWDAITYFYPNIIHVQRERPEYIFGKKILMKTHSSDVMRIEALLKYGGIYMDTDTLIVKPIKKLMDHPFVLSNQSSGVYGSAFIMSERNAKFLQLWYNEYRRDYQPKRYIYNAMISTKKLAQNETNKQLLHVEYGTISRPIGMLGGSIYQNKYATKNWGNIYGLHSYIRIFKEHVNETTIRYMNHTFGSVCRHIFYGNKELCL